MKLRSMRSIMLAASVLCCVAAADPSSGKTALDGTLDRLRALQHQSQPPKKEPVVLAPKQDTPARDDTDKLTPAQRIQIGNYIRRCWATDPAMTDLDHMVVRLEVTTDGAGVIRKSVIAKEDEDWVLRNPRLHAYALRAIRSVMDPNCANLPLPQSMLGTYHTFTFRFRP